IPPVRAQHRTPSPSPRSVPQRSRTNPGPNPARSTGASAPQTKHAEDTGEVEFRSDTILVQVPTVITDKAGNHVHNLSRDDFHLYEGKKEEKISAFEEIIASNSPIERPAPVAGEFTNVAIDERQPRSLIVIALDTINTPFLDQTYARQQLVKYLSN